MVPICFLILSTVYHCNRVASCHAMSWLHVPCQALPCCAMPYFCVSWRVMTIPYHALSRIWDSRWTSGFTMDVQIHDGPLDSRWISGFTMDFWLHDGLLDSRCISGFTMEIARDMLPLHRPGWPRAMPCHVMASRATPGHIFACHAIFLRVMPCHDHSVSCRVRIFLEKMPLGFLKKM